MSPADGQHITAEAVDTPGAANEQRPVKNYRPERLPIFRALVQAASANYAHFSQVAQHARRRFGRHLNAAPTADAYTQHAQWILTRLRTKGEAWR
jgi:hypothetical protein